jgi:hypothetical protein
MEQEEIQSMEDEIQYLEDEEIKYKTIYIDCLWMDVFSPANPDLEVTHCSPENGVEMPFRASMNFDYETLPGHEFRLHIDLKMKFDHVAVANIRLCYVFYPSEKYNWELFFGDRDLIFYTLDHAFEQSYQLFKNECKERNAGFPEDFVIIDDDLEDILIQMEKDMYRVYWQSRRLMDEANMPDGGKIVLICPQTQMVLVTMNATFMVLDEILFINNRFNRKHNQTEFFKHVPEVWYYTLRQKCMQITKHKVELSDIFHKLFYKCVDCSVQLLLGEHSETLIATLEPDGLTKEFRDMFVKSASELISSLRKTNKQFMNDPKFFLNEKIDWNSLIK